MNKTIHLIPSGGDGSVALCGQKFPENTTFIKAECTCDDCKKADE